jgi:hypothetical protein
VDESLRRGVDQKITHQPTQSSGGLRRARRVRLERAHAAIDTRSSGDAALESDELRDWQFGWRLPQPGEGGVQRSLRPMSTHGQWQVGHVAIPLAFAFRATHVYRHHSVWENELSLTRQSQIRDDRPPFVAVQELVDNLGAVFRSAQRLADDETLADLGLAMAVAEGATDHEDEPGRPWVGRHAVLVRHLSLGSPFEVVVQLGPIVAASASALATILFAVKRLFGYDLELKTYRQERRREYLSAKREADQAEHDGASVVWPGEIGRSLDRLAPSSTLARWTVQDMFLVDWDELDWLEPRDPSEPSGDAG